MKDENNSDYKDFYETPYDVHVYAYSNLLLPKAEDLIFVIVQTIKSFW